MLEDDIDDIVKPWYADDAGAAGNYDNIEKYFVLLVKEGPARGYFPEPTRFILVV